MDSQLIINSAFGIISVLAGWVFRMVWGRIQDLEDDLEDLEKHHEADLKEARKEISELALAMPEKYVAKQDLDKLIDFINERFNKLENKIDNLKN
jgi:peptidoglycan hydrolase CwlO-like protein